MQGKWSKVRNFTSEERKQSKNHCSQVKLESKKNDKKSNGFAGRVGLGDKIVPQGKVTTRLVTSILSFLLVYMF